MELTWHLNSTDPGVSSPTVMLPNSGTLYPSGDGSATQEQRASETKTLSMKPFRFILQK